MANLIRHKRGTSNPVAGDFSETAELLVNTTDGGLFTRTDGGSVVEIGGDKLPLSGGQMTGSITFSGSQTVDGRDVSADGAKLDGIESGATADQTASEILTAIKTVDGSGSELDADTVDGLQAASFIRSDTNDTFSGNLNNTSTGYFQASVGTTAQRPGSPAQGMIRFNTTEGCFEGYNGSSWVNMSPITVDDVGTV